MTRVTKGAASASVGSRWAELLARRAFVFVGVGAVIGAVVFGYLFFPNDGRSWAEVWVSRGGAWALGAWGLAIVCVSCGVRGVSLRIYRWRQAKALQSEEELEDLHECQVEHGTG